MLQSVKRRLSSQSSGSSSNDSSAVSPTSAAGAQQQGDAVGRSDLSLPKRDRRRSSFQKGQKLQALKDLPLLKDTPMQKREVG